MADEKKSSFELPHHMVLDGRERLSITGVVDVASFDEENVTLDTTKGAMVIKGQQLHIDRLNLQNGELNLEGLVYSIEYDDDLSSKGGWWSKLFG